MSEPDKCPVNHADMKSFGAGCPVDHSKWKDHGGNGGEGLPPLPDVPQQLSAEREVSTIPRADNKGNWVYPSEQQFFSAMKRKSHNPEARDMSVVIPIHNAVNERTWLGILQWENGWGGDKCGGPKLVKFEGDASKWTPRAYMNYLLGNKPPFDRHDWVVDRCGKRIEYVIDYYAGAANPANPYAASFYLDVRPKLNSLEGVKMRVCRFFGLA
ncbi:Putative cytochrome c1 heme lyase [Wickerhamiella sorbophila]|uniref:Holocytochrome c-type synthase n=1 Tax=Wickerhamiella sorbophila TaxID=45607 RepID=A0A2T0FJF7_9ASCO|nr:Putative cytochrome c1 heme lyase [Wickerhamiella sorbophila]PRT55144.1 Putative cytochrome c1 heme lyase [Wickerhamiella sorbophila]